MEDVTAFSVSVQGSKFCPILLLLFKPYPKLDSFVMNLVLQCLDLPSWIYIWVLNLCHACRSSHQISPMYSPRYSHQLHPMHVPSPSLMPTHPAMQIVVQDKHLHLDKEVVLAIIFASIAVTLVMLSAFCACFIWRRNGIKSDEGNNEISDTNGEFTAGPVLNHCNLLSIRESIPEVEYSLIEAATNNFSESNILGKGRHGLMYKAHFNIGIVAAVKKIDSKVSGLERAFEKEIVLLSYIKHPNIISLLGYSVNGEEKVLVYELMQNGSLETQLNGSSGGLNLTWQRRMKIALDTARGLEYLHEHCKPPLVHRALKSSNILLDSNFDAKISDFSLAIAGGNQNEHNIKLLDTRDYAAPEYFLNGEFTAKSDVYAFGIVLLELLMGRKAVDRMIGSQRQSGTTWAMLRIIDREMLPDIVDPVIRHAMDLKHLCQVAAVAVLCVQQEPSYRPLITDVVYSLIPLVPTELGGTLRVSERQS